jgi:ABC-2 type transport system permease protein
MNRRRIKNVLLKEWLVLFTDPNGTMIVTILPFLIVGQAMLYVWLAVKFGGDTILASEIFQNAISKLQQAQPAVSGLVPTEQLLVLLLNQFTFFLLLIPTMIAISVATFSIVEEKLSRSLEALLATPVRTSELLLGKALAGALPAVIATWVCAGVFLLATSALGWGHLHRFVTTPSWFLSLFVLTPAITLLSFILGVIASSRAKDARGAQTLSLAVIFPIFALIGVQITGLVWFTPLLTLALAAGVVLVDVLALRGAVRLFRRESIIIEWR